jgi:hypothetical protein
MDHDHEHEKAFAALYKNGRRPTLDELLAADAAGPRLLTPTRKQRFNHLRRELGMTRRDLAKMLDRPFGTVQAWGQPARPEMIPPDDVLAAMHDALVRRAVDVVRQSGDLDVIPRKAA